MITIFLFGIVTVFFVFLILYLFSVVLKFFSGKERPAVVEEKKTRYSRENEEIIAVISAVLSQIIEGDYRIVSVKKQRKTRIRGMEKNWLEEEKMVRKFRVVVNGKEYIVEVEEIGNVSKKNRQNH